MIPVGLKQDIWGEMCFTLLWMFSNQNVSKYNIFKWCVGSNMQWLFILFAWYLEKETILSILNSILCRVYICTFLKNKNYVYLRLSISLYTYLSFCFVLFWFVVRTSEIYCLSKFSLYSTVLLTTGTVLLIRALELIYPT